MLEGPQGALKSSALRALCADDQWFLEDLSDITGKDALLQFGGKWIVEIAELQSFKGAADGRLKAFISKRVDTYRPPYGRITQDYPRSVVLAGTTNDLQFLEDSTGGRRFWCLECGTIDLDGIVRDRDQLWAEAVAEYQAHKPWWLEHGLLIQAAEEEQEARRIPDPWETVIADFLARHDEDFTITGDAIFTHLEEPANHHQGPARARIARTKADEMRLGKVLRVLGWRRTFRGPADDRQRCWTKKPKEKGCR